MRTMLQPLQPALKVESGVIPDIAANDECDIFALPAAPDDIDLAFLDGLLGDSVELPEHTAGWDNLGADLGNAFVHEPAGLSSQCPQAFHAIAQPIASYGHSEAGTPACSTGNAPAQQGAPSPSTDAASSHHTHEQGSAPSSPGSSGRDKSSSKQQQQHDSSDNSAGVEDERKKAIRMQRNRESAQLSRQRKKLQLSELEKKNTELANHNKYLSGVVGHLTAENIGLRQQLMQICQQTNTPLPAMPPPCVPMPMPGVPMVMPMPGYAMHPMASGVVPAGPVFGGGVPKMPLPKLEKPARPEPAAKSGGVAGKRGSGSRASAGATKKAKVAAGWSGTSAKVEPYAALPQASRQAGRIMLSRRSALDTATQGPPIPLPPTLQEAAAMQKHAADSASDQRGSLGDRDASGSSDSSSGSSRDAGLLPSNGSWEATGGAGATLVPAPMGMREEDEWEVVEPVPGQQLAERDTGNSTSVSLNGSSSAWGWLTNEGGADSSRRAELGGKALQRLLDASSTALVWDPDWAAQQPALLDVMPHWGSFPALLGNALQAEGLMSPLTCDKVFEVDATSLPDGSKLRRRMESYLSSLQGFRGRAIPLPLAAADAKEDTTHQAGSTGELPFGGKGDMLVSVVLPVKPQGMLTALDRLFVVLLQQSTVYATYSCQLPKLGFI